DGSSMLLNLGKFHSDERIESGPPVLSKVPYVNRLFKKTSYGREAQDMIVLVTPRVIVCDEACEKCPAAKCCDACPKCCEACPKCKPVAEEEASVPVRPLTKAAPVVVKSPVEQR